MISDSASVASSQWTSTSSSKSRLGSRLFATRLPIFPLFEVLEPNYHRLLSYLSLLVQFLQCLAFVLNPHFPHGETLTTVSNILYTTHLPFWDKKFVSSITFMKYIPMFAIAAFLILSLPLVVLWIVMARVPMPRLGKPTVVLRLHLHAITSVLFIPLLQAMLSQMVCKNGRLWTFPDKECYTSETLPTFIIGIIAVVFLGVTTYVSDTTLSVENYRCEHPLARKHFINDVANVTWRILTCVLYHVFVSNSVATASSTWFPMYIACSSILMMFTYMFFLPFVHQSTSKLFTTTFLFLFFTGMLVFFSADSVLHPSTAAARMGMDSVFAEVDADGVLFFALALLVIVVGWFLADVRINRELTDSIPQLIDAAAPYPVHYTIMYPKGLPIYDVAYGVNNDLCHEVADGAINEGRATVSLETPYLTRIWFYTDIEVSTRFLGVVEEITGGYPTPEMLDLATRIYVKGLLRYRDSAHTILSLANMIHTYTTKPSLALIQCERTNTLPCSFPTRYRAYRMLTRLRKELHLRDSAYQRTCEQARRSHKELLVSMHQFWLKLLAQQDQMQLIAVYSNITLGRQETNMQFLKALKHPTSDLDLLLKYADFLETVMLREDQAEQIRSFAKRERDELRNRTAAGQPSAEGGGADDVGVEQHNLLLEIENDHLSGTKSSAGRRILGLHVDSHSLAEIILIVVALLVALGFLLLAVIGADRRADALRCVEFSATARNLQPLGNLLAIQYWVGNNGNIATPSPGFTVASAPLLQSISAISTDLLSIHNYLTYGLPKSITGERENYWTSRYVILPFFSSVTTTFFRGTSFMSLGYALAQRLNDVVGILGRRNSLKDAATLYQQQTAITGLLNTNTHTWPAGAYNMSVQRCREWHAEECDNAILVLAVLFAVGILCLVLFAEVMSLPNPVEKLKHRTLALFTMVPRAALLDIAHQARMQIDLFEQHDAEEDETGGGGGAGGARGRGASTAAAGEFDGDGDDEEVRKGDGGDDGGQANSTAKDSARELEQSDRSDDEEGKAAGGGGKDGATAPAQRLGAQGPGDGAAVAAGFGGAAASAASTGGNPPKPHTVPYILMGEYVYIFVLITLLAALLVVSVYVAPEVTEYRSVQTEAATRDSVYATAVRQIYELGFTLMQFFATGIASKEAEVSVLEQTFYTQLPSILNFRPSVDEVDALVATVRKTVDLSTIGPAMATFLANPSQTLSQTDPYTLVSVSNPAGEAARNDLFAAHTGTFRRVVEEIASALHSSLDLSAEIGEETSGGVRLRKFLVAITATAGAGIGAFLIFFILCWVRYGKVYTSKAQLILSALIVLTLIGVTISGGLSIRFHDDLAATRREYAALLSSFPVVLRSVLYPALIANLAAQQGLNAQNLLFLEYMEVSQQTAAWENFLTTRRLVDKETAATLEKDAQTLEMLEKIALVLLGSNVAGNIATFPSFTWNFESEPDAIEVRVRYPDDYLRYSQRDVDLLKPADRKVLMARSAVSGGRAADLLMNILDTLQDVYFSGMEELTAELSSQGRKVSSCVDAAIGCSAGALVVGALLIILFIRNHAEARRHQYDQQQVAWRASLEAPHAAAAGGAASTGAAAAGGGGDGDDDDGSGSPIGSPPTGPVAPAKGVPVAAAGAMSATAAASSGAPPPAAPGHSTPEYNSAMNVLLTPRFAVTTLVVVGLFTALFVVGFYGIREQRHHADMSIDYLTARGFFVTQGMQAGELWGAGASSTAQLKARTVSTYMRMEELRADLTTPTSNAYVFGFSDKLDKYLLGPDAVVGQDFRYGYEVGVTRATQEAKGLIFVSGLEGALQTWMQQVLELGDLSTDSARWSQIQRLRSSVMQLLRGVDEASHMLLDGIFSRARLFTVLEIIFSCAMMLLFLAEIFLTFVPRMRRQAVEVDGYQMLVRLIPREVRERVAAIREYVAANKTMRDQDEDEAVLEHTLRNGALEESNVPTDAISLPVVSITRAGIVLTFNQKAEALFGYDAAEVIGNNVSMLMPDRIAGRHDSFLSNFEKNSPRPLNRLLFRNRSVHGRMRNGTLVPLDLTVHEMRRSNGEGAYIAFMEDKSANAKLLRDEALDQFILNNTMTAMIAIDSLGTILRFNRASEECFGYAMDEVIGHNIKLLMPEDLASRHDHYLAAYLRTRKKKVIDGTTRTRGLRKNGEEFSIEIKVREMELVDGSTRTYLGFIRDLTEDAPLDEAILVSSVVLETSTVPIVVTDLNGKIVLFSRAAERVFGFTAAEAMGHNCKMLMPGIIADRHDSFMEAYRTSFNKRVGYMSDREVVGRHKDGHLLALGATLQEVPATHSSSGNGAIIGYFRELNEQRHMERARAIEEVATEHHTTPLVVIDGTGIIRRINPATTIEFGYHTDELVGQNVSVLMPEEMGAQHNGYLSRYHTTGVAGVIGKRRRFQARRRTGALFPIELRVREVTPKENPDNTPSLMIQTSNTPPAPKPDAERLYVGFIRNITKELQLERQVAINEAGLEHSPTPQLLVNTRTGTIVRCNRAAAALLGGAVADDGGSSSSTNHHHQQQHNSHKGDGTEEAPPVLVGKSVARFLVLRDDGDSISRVTAARMNEGDAAPLLAALAHGGGRAANTNNRSHATTHADAADGGPSVEADAVPWGGAPSFAVRLRATDVSTPPSLTRDDSEEAGPLRLISLTDCRQDGAAGRQAALNTAVMDHSPAPMILFSRSTPGGILRMNAAAVRRFGWTAEEAEGRSITALLPEGALYPEGLLVPPPPPDDMGTTVPPPAPELRPCRTAGVTKSGRRFPTRTALAVLPAARSGGAETVLAVVEDLSDALRTHAMTERSGVATELSPDPLIAVNGLGIILYCNAATARAFGYPNPGQLTGRNVKMLMPMETAVQHDGYLVAYLKTRQGRRVGRTSSVQCKRADGSVFPAALRLEELQMPAADGTTPAAATTAEDVIFVGRLESSAAAAEAEAQRHLLDAMLRLVPDALVVINEQGIIQRVSETVAPLFGYDPKDPADALVGQNVKVLMPAAVAAEHDRYLTEYLRTGRKHLIDRRRRLQAQRKDGSAIEVEVGVREVRLGVCRERFFVGALRDLTATNDLLEQRRASAAIADGCPVPLLVLSSGGTVRTFTSAAEAFFGYPGAEVLGEPVSLLLPQLADGAGDVAGDGSLAVRLAEAGAEGATCAARCRSGAVVPVHLVVQTLLCPPPLDRHVGTAADLWADGDALEYLIYVMDARFETSVARATRHAAAAVQSLVTSAVAPMLVVAHDTGLVREANEAALRLLGYSAEELQDRPLATIAPKTSTKLLAPLAAAAAATSAAGASAAAGSGGGGGGGATPGAAAAAAAAGVPESVATHRAIAFVAKDGGDRLADVRLLDSVWPLPGVTSAVSSTVRVGSSRSRLVFFADTRAATAQRVRAEQRLRTLVDQVSMPVLYLSVEDAEARGARALRITAANDAAGAVLRCPARALRGQLLVDLLVSTGEADEDGNETPEVAQQLLGLVREARRGAPPAPGGLITVGGGGDADSDGSGDASGGGIGSRQRDAATYSCSTSAWLRCGLPRGANTSYSAAAGAGPTQVEVGVEASTVGRHELILRLADRPAAHRRAVQQQVAASLALMASDLYLVLSSEGQVLQVSAAAARRLGYLKPGSVRRARRASESGVSGVVSGGEEEDALAAARRALQRANAVADDFIEAHDRAVLTADNAVGTGPGTANTSLRTVSGGAASGGNVTHRTCRLPARDASSGAPAETVAVRTTAVVVRCRCADGEVLRLEAACHEVCAPPSADGGAGGSIETDADAQSSQWWVAADRFEASVASQMSVTAHQQQQQQHAGGRPAGSGSSFAARMFVLVLKDPTQQRQHNALAALSAALVDCDPTAMVIMDPQGVVRQFNRAAERLLQFQKEQVVGRNVSLLMPAAIGAQHEVYLRRYRESGVKKVVDAPPRVVTAERKDGKLIEVSLTVRQVSAPDGKTPHMFIGFLRPAGEEGAAAPAAP